VLKTFCPAIDRAPSSPDSPVCARRKMTMPLLFMTFAYPHPASNLRVSQHFTQIDRRAVHSARLLCMHQCVWTTPVHVSFGLTALSNRRCVRAQGPDPARFRGPHGVSYIAQPRERRTRLCESLADEPAGRNRCTLRVSRRPIVSLVAGRFAPFVNGFSAGNP
jgi:hypothetical protein